MCYMDLRKIDLVEVGSSAWCLKIMPEIMSQGYLISSSTNKTDISIMPSSYYWYACFIDGYSENLTFNISVHEGI